MGLSKVIIRKDKANKLGECPIYIRIILERKTTYISTGLRANLEEWNETECRFKIKYRKAEDVDKANQNMLNNEIIEKKLREADLLIKNLILDDNLNSSSQVKEELVKSSSIGKDSVLSFIDIIIDEFRAQKRLGTSNTYRDLKRALKKYLLKLGKSDISFKEINVVFLRKFESDFRQRAAKDTSISYFMRTLRAVFNAAIERRMCKKESYPFENYKISNLNTKTVKRAITKTELELLRDYCVDKNLREYHSLNYFMFSYYCLGINFSDLAMLKWQNIQNNRLSYVRLKTGKPYSFLLLEPALKILEIYRQELNRGGDNYIFPILDAESHKTPESINNRIHKVITHTNHDLKVIGEKLKISVPLTTYVARHTFATVMKRGGVSTSLISAAMGHDTERTTQIYLDSFENDVLDDATKTLLL